MDRGIPGSSPHRAPAAEVGGRRARRLSPDNDDEPLATATDRNRERGRRGQRRAETRPRRRAFASHRLAHTLLPKVLALPVFASDPLSSVAYATGEILIALSLVTAHPEPYVMPIAGAIAALMAIVIVSYPTDRAGVSERRRRLHRQQGEPGHHPWARRCSGPDVRLHDDGGGLDRRRCVRDRVGLSARQRAQGAPVDLLRRLHHGDEPARDEGIGHLVRGSRRTASPSRSCPSSRSGSSTVPRAARASGWGSRACTRLPRSLERWGCSPILKRLHWEQPRSPAWRRSRTACRRSGRRRRGTPRRRFAVMGAIAITMFLGISWLATHVGGVASEERSVVGADRDRGVRRRFGSASTSYRSSRR